MYTPAVWQKGSKTLIHLVFPLHILDENASVGERIRFYRKKRDMSCNTLAARIGVSRYAIMDYEKGTTEPTLDMLNQIANALNITPDKLYDDYFRFLDYPYSAKIKELRKFLKLTQQEFGDLIGINRKTVERWEKGKNTVTRDLFHKIKKLELK